MDLKTRLNGDALKYYPDSSKIDTNERELYHTTPHGINRQFQTNLSQKIVPEQNPGKNPMADYMTAL